MNRKILALVLSAILLFTAIPAAFAELTLPAPAASTSRDTMNVAIAQDANGFCPITSGYSQAVLVVTRNVYEGLVWRDTSGNIAPILATEYAWDEDGLGLTFKLREGVTFTNGEAFDADDVVWTYRDFYLNTSFGASENVFDFANIEKIDDYTVHIPMLKKAGDALALLCDTKYDIMNQQAVEEAGDFYVVKPVGTGPYVLESYVEGDGMVLTANPNYWGGVPAITTINVRIIPESTQVMIEMENGNIDLSLNPSKADCYAALQGDFPGIVAHEFSDGNVMCLYFNYRKDWAQNKSVRECISYAINKDDIMMAAYEGLAKTANQMMGRVYADSYIDEYDENPLYSYDPDKAIEKLAESGYAPGELTMDFFVDQDNAAGLTAQVIKNNLEAVGINVNVGVFDSQAWVGNVLAGEGDIHVNIGCSGNGYPISYLSNSDPNKTPNWDDYASYADSKRVFEFYTKAQEASDPAEIFRYVQDGVRIVAEEALCVPLVETQGQVLMREELKGVVYYSDNYFSYMGAYFE